ncbi:non-specific lipid-transfer protein-like protein At2g13820 [Asparagus officinalis]|uniref:non-specific lipid-transfer protein-like protein At2g13820 n=1 Tax=Asparagus officinalis TaxID=4686 RepID=UPI00098E3891|nr:non-specific lipid-transfer protein-like protein At2g13820 [Asparagus officinalis]
MAQIQKTANIFSVLAFALAVMLVNQASAQSVGCTTAIVSLAPCLGYITGNSSTPSTSCCSQLSSVVQTQAQCLCSLLNGGGSSFGININQTQALTLPGACKVKTPPVSQCNAAGGPATSPSSSPSTPTTPSTTPSTPSTSTPTTPATPSVPSIPSGTGSKTTPSAPGGDSSDASILSTFFSAVLAVVSVSLYAIL